MLGYGVVNRWAGNLQGQSFDDVMPFMTDDEDSATVYLDLQPSSADVLGAVDSATVYLDLWAYSAPTAVVYLNLQPLGGECYSTFSAEQFGEGEASLRWTGIADPRWSGDANARWTATVSVGDQIHC